jgi:O-succinylbenzoic acid--CoA ligase
MMQSLPDWLQHWSRARPDHPALMDGGHVVSFAEMAERVDLAARRFATLGVGQGDRVAVLLREGVDLVVVLHALPRIGAVVLPLHRRLTATEIEWQLRDGRAALLCYDETSRATATRLAGSRCCVTGDPLEGDRRLDSIPARARVVPVAPGIDTLHTVLYTSGSTGRPKAVELSWGNHFWSAMGSAFNLGVCPDDRWLACLPMAHVGGLSILLRSLIYGSTVVIQNRFDPAEANRAIDTRGVTIVSLVANMLRRMVDLRGGKAYPPALRCVLLGGGPAPRALLETCARLKVPVIRTYGLTETASQVTAMPLGEALRKAGSSGRPLLSSRVRIVDAGREVALCEVGEILVKGPTVSAAVLEQGDSRDGWLSTGDLGSLDEEGFLYVVGRRDDTIISGGENVHPTEVETQLESHPAVAEACVVGTPDPDWGEIVTAFVRLRSRASTTADELQAHVRCRLAGFKIPRRFFFVDDLPRTASGKVARSRLRRDCSGIATPSDL